MVVVQQPSKKIRTSENNYLRRQNLCTIRSVHGAMAGDGLAMELRKENAQNVMELATGNPNGFGVLNVMEVEKWFRME